MGNCSRISSVVAVIAAIGITGCSHPNSAPNAAASALQAEPNVPLHTEPTTGQEISAVAANHVSVIFPAGSARLTLPAGQQLDLAARLFRDVNPVRMFVSGHADPLGDDYANLLLSARRAQTVKEGLVARGIPAERLLLQALGTSEPASGDGNQVAEDRRVVVTWRIL